MSVFKQAAPAAIGFSLLLGGGAPCTLADTPAALFDDAHLDLELRTVWERTRTATEDDWGRSTSHEEQLGQVMALRFTTGYLADLIALDATWFGVEPLHYDDEKATGNWHTSDFFQDDKRSFDKTAALLKFKPWDFLRLRTGRTEMHHVLLGPGELRTTPRLYQLTDAQLQLGDLTLTGIWSDRASRRTSSHYAKFSGKRDGKTVDEPVKILDLRWSTPYLDLQAAYGRQDSILEYYFTDLSSEYALSDTLQLSGGLQFRRKSELLPNYDPLTQWSTHLRLDWYDAWINLAYSSVEDGQFGQTMGVDWFLEDGFMAGCKSNGFYIDPVIGLFNHAGENAQMIQLGYDFSAWLPGVSGSAYYIRGWDMYNGDPYVDDQRHHASGFELAWQPPAISGLKVQALFGKDTMTTAGDYAFQQIMNSGQLWLTYQVSLF